MLYKKPKPDCHRENLGLDKKELAALGGFSFRAFGALAHLREAWLTADLQNRGCVTAALRALFLCHSMQDNRDLALKVLRHNHDRGTELTRELWPQRWDGSWGKVTP